MNALLDLTGQRFFSWIVTGRGTNRGRCTMWSCVCDCGVAKDVGASNLTDGRSRSCGHGRPALSSLISTTHGESDRTPEYFAWMGMKNRCKATRGQHLKDYVKRGITVCRKWERSYEAFLAHIGRRPSAGHSLDRINNNLGYRPGNVRWATRQEQNANRHYCRKFTAFGETKTVSEWARDPRCLVSCTCILRRTERGIPFETAIATKGRIYDICNRI